VHAKQTENHVFEARAKEFHWAIGITTLST